MFAKFAPSLWEELAGLADELGVSMEVASYWFGNEGMRPPISGMSEDSGTIVASARL